ncbi:MAG: DNA helicase II [Gammaproteobacteria bacterium]|nr:DNA helicase II [Gammaproteobacteria bacterium]
MSEQLLTSLNPEQREAVAAPAGNVLVLAGAGSGKTRVLAHRIAWLIQQEQVSPFSIMAVTFTNKAAREMQTRIEALCGFSLRGMWVGTFHGLAHRFLRKHWQDASLVEGFQILDADDQQRLVKRIMRSLELDDNKWPPKQAQWFINHCKEEGKRPRHIHPDSYFTEVMQRVYQAYTDVCERSGLVDFSELLLRTLETLQTKPELQQHYHQRFQHILVDEFQDTNTIQYRWLQTITSESAKVMAVGDDDQSIYSWRGAKVENIQRFTKEFKNTQTIRLEQNYRSTQTILDAANAVIENNSGRLGKNLWTEGTGGDPITLYTAFNERDEAHYVVSSIQDWVLKGNRYQDMAILYRSNAQSRILEEQLIDAQVPYRIYGGVKFFERAEIKDALAYLRLITNRQDDASFERVVNLPTRGVGNTTINTLRQTAREQSLSLWQGTLHLIEHKLLSARALNALQGFLSLIETLAKETAGLDLGEQCDHVIHRSGLAAHYGKDKSEKGLSRLENLEELVNACSSFKIESADDNLTPLDAFLAHVALETGEAQAEANSDAVNLMTLHAAKGLEFPIVFITGMEEELFPHRMSTETPNGLEEERRLCYVGMTRAMEKLFISHAECRRLYGNERFNPPSRFIQEIPTELLDAIRPTPKVSRPTQFNSRSSQSNTPTRKTRHNDIGLKINQRVLHQKFGPGMVINFEGQGEHTRIQVKFDKAGVKWLVANYAKLETL